jgi:putative pyoverdin transport system ATP-binding/permease protein
MWRRVAARLPGQSDTTAGSHWFSDSAAALIWAAAVAAVIAAVLDRVTVLRASGIAFGAASELRGHILGILLAIAGVAVFGSIARFAGMTFADRFINSALIRTTRRLLEADWREVVAEQHESRMAQIVAHMRSDAHRVVATLPDFAILPVTVAWLGLKEPIALLIIAVAGAVGLLLVQRALPRALASESVLTNTEAAFDRAVGRLLDAGSALNLAVAHQPDFHERASGPAIDDATRAATIDSQSQARLAGLLGWLGLAVMLVLLGVAPENDADNAWMRAIIVVAATLYPARKVFFALIALRRLRGLATELNTIGHGLLPAQTTTAIAPARWKTMGLRQACVDRRDMPGRFIAAIGPVDLDLRAGEIVALTGPRAEDPLTLLYVLCGLIPPDSGIVLLDGRPVPPQIVRGLCGGLLDADSLLAPVRPLPDSPRAASLLARFDLSRRQDIDDAETPLTDAERIRHALVAAEIEDRPIRLYDERVARLDRRFREAFTETLREARSRGRLCIVATSDADLIAAADRVLRMEDGRLVQPGEATP